MKLLKKLKDRYNILIIILTLLFLIISFRLASLTIVQGEEFRKLSDTKRVRQIAITAPRGEIRDRYGRLLAGNRPSFTVQILKDELNIKDTEERNAIILKLVRILEDGGTNYIDDYPININTFKYIDELSYYQSSITPLEYVTDTIVKNNLLSDILDITKEYHDSLETMTFAIGKEAVNILENEGYEMPIIIDFSKDGEIHYNFDTNIDINKWKNNNDIPIDLSAKESLVYLLNMDKKYVNKLINNSRISELAYEFLKAQNLIDNIELEEFSFTFDDEYQSMKRMLIKSYNGISMTSSAKEDFINIVLDSGVIYQILNNIYTSIDEDGEIKNKTIPAELLISKFEERQIELPIEISLDEEDGLVNFRFINDSERDKFLREEKIDSELTPIDALIYLSQKYEIIDDFIVDDNVKGIAQEKVLETVNPKISIANWEYVSINNKNNWFSKYNIPEGSSAEEAFEYLREKKQIREDIDKFEARAILLITEQLSNQGYRAYQPINLAYDISDKTVAKIEENIMELPGVKVSIESIRYYPMGETAAHILGYLGKISQSSEIKKYIDELGYSPNDIIGKTGVEESFEEYLNGVDGSRQVEVDVLGNTITVLDEQKAIPGNNLYLTIDAKLQKVAEDSLKQALEEIQIGGEFESEWGNYKYSKTYKNATSGAVVAIDVKTGEILALANYPAYDPNLFVTGISSEDWNSLLPENEEDPLAPRPLYNIALQTAVQPGSTFKMVTGLAALEAGISPEQEIYDYGYVEIGNRKFGCWYWNDYGMVHGWENLYEALRDSCNYYFYSITLGKNLRNGASVGGKVEIEDILNMAKELGLDEKTGIEIIGERASGVPDVNSKTNSIKNGLRRFLNSNIIKYEIEDGKLDEEDIKIAIDEIVSWAEYENPLSKREVINKLAELGFDGEKKIEGNREDLADIIKYSYLNQAGWKQADTLNISIGQGQNAYTPIQMANYMATLSNGGYRHKASVISKVENHDNSETIYEPDRESSRIQLSDYNFLNEIGKGLEMVTSEGSVRTMFQNLPIQVAAKTGTAQKDGINPITGEEYDNFAWFVSYAPYEENNPSAAEIAVAVVVFQGGSGGYPGPVAREIIAEYLDLNVKNVDEINQYNKLAR